MNLPLTTLLIDGHIHVYPQYDRREAIESLLTHLAANGDKGSRRIGLLAESRACRFFQEVTANGASFHQGTLRLEAGPDTGAITIRQNGIIAGYIIAGRQIVTAEKLEVLALGVDFSLADGLPVETTVKAIRDQGAIPVLSWSPGKWFFGRGKLVENLIMTQTPGSFLMGDTGLRPTLWPLPGLMRMAARRGFKTIGGSDPLPLPGEERGTGSYGFKVTAEFDESKPAASLRTILGDPASMFTPIGKRCGTLGFLSRWIRNQLRKR